MAACGGAVMIPAPGENWTVTASEGQGRGEAGPATAGSGGGRNVPVHSIHCAHGWLAASGTRGAIDCCGCSTGMAAGSGGNVGDSVTTAGVSGAVGCSAKGGVAGEGKDGTGCGGSSASAGAGCTADAGGSSAAGAGGAAGPSCPNPCCALCLINRSTQPGRPWTPGAGAKPGWPSNPGGAAAGASACSVFGGKVGAT
mmetsp:Transcript_41017/g.118517  ORF Transcript_41017/g.118517 Transcript_41017/m.118517 type:complete len:198 (+) Transcript_41017:749-1342(+)